MNHKDMEISQKQLSYILGGWVFIASILFSIGVFAYFNKSSADDVSVSDSFQNCLNFCKATGEDAAQNKSCQEICETNSGGGNGNGAEPNGNSGNGTGANTDPKNDIRGSCTLNNEIYSEGQDFCNEGNYYKCTKRPCQSNSGGCLGFEIIKSPQSDGFCGGGGVSQPDQSIVPLPPPQPETPVIPGPTNNPPTNQGYCNGSCYQLEHYASYPDRFACRGGQGTGYENRCFVCTNGTFVEQRIQVESRALLPNLSACSSCYGQCLGDTSPVSHENGYKCPVYVEGILDVFVFNTGQWIDQDMSNFCVGQC